MTRPFAAAAVLALSATTAAAQEAPFPVLRTAVEGLPDYTLYQPQGAGDAPLLIWGNGSCKASNWQALALLTALAADGHAILAIGAPGSTDEERREIDPARMTAAMDWAEGDGGAATLGGTPERIVTIGWSCGGVEAMLAGRDPRVDAVVGLATGLFLEEDPMGRITFLVDELDTLTAPLLIATGGVDDIAHANGVANYDYYDGPATLVTHETAGHSGLVTGAYHGENVEVRSIDTTRRLVTDWLAWQLDGDADAEASFTAADCDWCAAPWSARTKGF